MREFVSNRWTRVGIWIAVLGWGPFAVIVLLSSVGVWPDPEPDPIGAGMLFFATFWPALCCLMVGLAHRLRPKTAVTRKTLATHRRQA